MADGFIVRKGGVATEQALAPTITQVATTETSITFTITNNDAETAIIRHRLDDITDEGVIVELATNATSANITVTTLAAGTEFTVFATANVTGKIKSNVTQLAISTNEIPAPTITLVSKTDTSVTFTLKNNSVQTRDVTFGLTTPPTTTTISLASNATSGNQTFSNLDDNTTITLFAQAEGGLIGQLNVTTDLSLVFTAATGGTTLEYNSGGKRFKSHTFTNNGNFVVSTVGDNVDNRNKVDYLIIAGGGSGGAGGDGGGGAGGFRTTVTPTPANTAVNSKVTVTATTFAVVVGAGATGSTSRTGANGSTSSVFSISATSGGGGGQANGLSGGSGGGGGGGAAGNGGAGTSGQGRNGGNGISAVPNYGSGGGGGAGAVGLNGGNTSGGNGGNGLANNLRTGSNETRAGGGGGGTYDGGTRGLGGTGGGGNAGITSGGNANGQNGTANTGGGGGGGFYKTTEPTAGSGGSGIVIIRYEIATV